MADTQNTAKSSTLSAKEELEEREQCHEWEDYPTHCALLHDRVAILTWKNLSCDLLHMSSMDLHSWTTTTLPYEYMALATYKSQFVLVGGQVPSTREFIDVVLTSDTGLEWQPSLPPMRTMRSSTTCISTRSQLELIVAGGWGDGYSWLDVVEVLIDNNWHKAHPLPEPCSDIRATLHQDEVVFTDRFSSTIYSCSIASLISSCTQTNTLTRVWTEFKAPRDYTTTVSYSSRLVSIDVYGVIRGYCSRSQSWLEVYRPDNERKDTATTAVALPTGDIVMAGRYGVYRVKVSVSTYDPDSKFPSHVLSRLEEVMGIQIMSVLGNNHSQLTASSGVELQTREYDRRGREIALPDPQSDPVLYVEEVIIQWSMRRSHRPPTWKQLLEIFQEMGLRELSQQIEAFMRGDYKFKYAYKHFIDSKDVLELLSLKFMFLGPPRLGKSTTRRRVMKEIVDLQSAEEAEQVHGSTGTVECCPNMLVQDSSDSASPGAHWTIIQNLIEEAGLLFHSLKDSLEADSVPQAATNSLVGSKTIAQVSEASSTEQPRTVQNSPRPKLLQKMMTTIKKSLTRSKRSTPEHVPPQSPVQAELIPESVTSSDYSEIAAIYSEVSQQPQFQRDLNHSLKAFLRMEDTGGQPELMDMLPALTIGPGLYLLFFSYEFNLDEEYRVFYQRDTGETTASEKSEFTLKEMLLCTLASISCSTASRTFQMLENTDDADMGKLLKSSKSVVYLVGTHKDKVSEEYILSMDEQLQKIITDTDFYKNGIIQFCSEEKLVVSLDNMTGGVKEVDELRQLLEKSMEKHFQKLKIPAVWLLFSLCLRMRDLRTASMEACLALAGAFNMSPYETKTALWFLHHHAGVLMYFPNVSGLEDLVIIDIQVVYDSITQVILNAMSFDNVGRAAAERFKKTGLFTLSGLTSAMTGISEDIIPPLKLVALLLHLHIIAQVLSHTPVTESLTDKSEYIMPCVLEYTNSKELELLHKEACHSSLVFPLFLFFTCGFTPMGLFPAMISCLISNKSFKLIREGIKKNMVQFIFKPNLKVTFMSRSKSYEVVVSCPLSIQDCLHKECRFLRREIEKTLEQASSRMNYSSYMDYQFGFECLHEGTGHLGVVDRAVLEPKVMECLFNPDSPELIDLHNRHLIWYGQEYKKDSLLEDYRGDNHFSMFLSLYPDLMNSVKLCVLELADHCVSVGLISGDIYDQIITRKDWINTDQARCLLNSIRNKLSAQPQAMKQFVSTLSRFEDCKFVTQKLQHQLK